MSLPAPSDPRVFHGYDDPPAHPTLITLGWCAAGVFSGVGAFRLVLLRMPSHPCGPGVDCGPETSSLLALALGLTAVGLIAAGWSLFWHLRDRQYRFQPPPNWPPVHPNWRPPRGWSPPPNFPKAPEGWRFWVPQGKR